MPEIPGGYNPDQDFKKAMEMLETPEYERARQAISELPESETEPVSPSRKDEVPEEDEGWEILENPEIIVEDEQQL